MKLTQLLTGVAAAAILTGAASAQLASTNIDATANNAEFIGTTLVPTGLDLSAADLVGATELQLDMRTLVSGGPAFAALSAADEVQIRFDFTGMELAQGVGGGALEPNGACASGGSVVDGGSVGDTFVVFEFSDPTVCDNAVDDLEVAFVLDAIASVGNVTATATEVGGDEVFSVEHDSNATTVAIEPLFFQFGAGIADVYAADGTLAVADADSGASGVPFDAFAAALDDDDYGDLDVSISAGYVIDLGSAGDTTDDVALAAAAVDDYDLVISLDNAGGFASATFAGSTIAFNDPSNDSDPNTATFEGLVAGDFPSAITLNAATAQAGNVIFAQTPTAELTANAASGTNLTLGSLGVVQLDDILREGFDAVDFEWVGAGGITNNIFRVTGIASGDGYVIDVTNSTEGLNGTYTLSPSRAPAGGEQLIDSADLAAAAGDFGRADVAITVTRDSASGAFSGATPPGDIQRMQVGPTGTLSDFGDDND